jgi:hypothetical protein
MKTVLRKYSMILWLVLLVSDCKKPYTPPAILGPNNYLVVDGVINTGTNSVTTIHLNRTRNLNDTVVTGIPELGAQIFIVQQNGGSYPLVDTFGKGLYTSAPLTLNPAGQYKIEITTADNKTYSSDYVTPKATPPIDSIFYEQPLNFTLYLTTHDPADTTHYYRWDYLETWEHDSRYQSPWELRRGEVWAKEPDSGSQQTDRCWTTAMSNTILLGNTTALSRDLVDKMPIVTLINNDLKLDIGYYILVRQYALTKEAYSYWQLIQKTSQQVGTLFDLQPTQLTGNIYCTSNPNEPVIGYMSASSIQTAHVFVLHSDLNSWPHYVYMEGCPTAEARRLSADDFHSWLYPDTAYGPYYFVSNGPLIVAPKRCMDCRYQGGVNVKPSFWP